MYLTFPVRTIISAIVDAILDGDKRKRSEIPGKSTSFFLLLNAVFLLLIIKTVSIRFSISKNKKNVRQCHSNNVTAFLEVEFVESAGGA